MQRSVVKCIDDSYWLSYTHASDFICRYHFEVWRLFFQLRWTLFSEYPPKEKSQTPGGIQTCLPHPVPNHRVRLWLGVFLDSKQPSQASRGIDTQATQNLLGRPAQAAHHYATWSAKYINYKIECRGGVVLRAEPLSVADTTGINRWLVIRQQSKRSIQLILGYRCPGLELSCSYSTFWPLHARGTAVIWLS